MATTAAATVARVDAEQALEIATCRLEEVYAAADYTLRNRYAMNDEFRKKYREMYGYDDHDQIEMGIVFYARFRPEASQLIMAAGRRIERQRMLLANPEMFYSHFNDCALGTRKLVAAILAEVPSAADPAVEEGALPRGGVKHKRSPPLVVDNEPPRKRKRLE